MQRDLVSNLQIKINRLSAQKAALETKQKRLNNASRKARTRTLIQMGGLMHMIGLSDLCGISEGDDLQLDMESRDKSAILLGLLTEIQEQLPPTLSDSHLETFKQKGIRVMKMHELKKFT